jgi:hypothetical protein
MVHEIGCSRLSAPHWQLRLPMRSHGDSIILSEQDLPPSNTQRSAIGPCIQRIPIEDSSSTRSGASDAALLPPKLAGLIEDILSLTLPLGLVAPGVAGMPPQTNSADAR